jgi:hypothetical protein
MSYGEQAGTVLTMQFACAYYFGYWFGYFTGEAPVERLVPARG